MDELDQNILRILMKDARTSYRQAAKELNVSTATVIKHVNSLEQEGVIKGYSAMLDFNKLGFEFRTIIFLKIVKGEPFDIVEEARSPSVLSVHELTGEFDACIVALFKTRKDLSEYVGELKKKPFLEDLRIEIMLTSAYGAVSP